MSDTGNIFGEHTGEYALLVAIVVAIIHMIGPWARTTFTNHTARVMSFGGGMAVAYVFLQLIPEIEHAHEYVGDSILIITLVSFLMFYGIEMHFRARSQNYSGEDNPGRTRIFWLHISLSWIYTALVLFALPSDVSAGLIFAVLGSLAIGLHLLYKDFVVYFDFGNAFQRKGRYVLATAPLIGWAAHVFIQPSEMIFDISIAILAGTILQGVFREELPDFDTARFGLMVTGAAVFLSLTLLVP